MDDPIDPERALALAYAPADARAALGALWRLDVRLASVFAHAREPMIRAIRLAWWREALEALDGATPPAEPLLQQVAAAILPRGVRGADLAAMEEGWARLADEPPDLAGHAAVRGRLLFTLAARLLGGDHPPAGDAGEGWAIVDRIVLGGAGDRAGDDVLLARARALLAPSGRWPRPLRPLAALAALARHDAQPGAIARLRPASPGRVARMMAAGLTGW